MSKPAGPAESSAPENLFFLAIEKVFIELRGAPLVLSPKDWETAREWYERGMPLDWIERTLREVFAKREKRGTADKLTTLRSCKRSVEAAWKRRQELMVGSAPEEI